MSSLKLNVVRLGKPENPPLIMLHGWGHNLSMLRPLGELLSEIFDVHLIDLPGFGKSEQPPSAWGTREYAETILNYVCESEFKQVNFLGHSVGGKILLRLASLNQEIINSLVLINASGMKPVRSFDRRIRIKFISILRALIKIIDKIIKTEIFKNWFIPRYASPDYLNAGEMRPTLIKIVNETLEEEASKINKPTLLLWGELDTETPLILGKKLHLLIKNSKLEVLKSKGHIPFLEGGEHLCMFYIKEFYKKLL